MRWTGASCEVADTVRGAAGRRVESFVHFDPAWSARLEGNAVELTRGSARVVVRMSTGPDMSLHRGESNPRCGWRAAGFNRVVASWTLRLAAPRYDGAEWRYTIEPG